jgi:short subunit dehydrogenase-like uncharacterized protein
MTSRIAVYGASGYQGRLVLVELARHGLDAVPVGRDPARLRAAVTNAPVRVAPADDHDALVAAFADCAVVVNCAGPFTTSGLAVARAAITAGAGYVDTSGEQEQLLRIFDTLASAAELAGVTLVPGTNDGCLPGDVLADLIARAVGPLREIVVGHVISGGARPSRGSLRSAAATRDALLSGGLAYRDGVWVPVTAPPLTLPFPGIDIPVPMRPLPLAEVVTIPRHVDVQRVTSYGEAALVEQLAAPLPAKQIESLPEGPTAQERADQRFTYVVAAVDRDGTTVHGTVHGIDTYGTTAAIAAEAARRLATDGARPGVLAPAQAFDPAGFLAFLRERGVRWSIESLG